MVPDLPWSALYDSSFDLTVNTGSAAQYVTIAVNPTTPSATVSSPIACTNNDAPCKLNATNALATDAIYIGRDANSSTYPQRLFISTSTAGNFQIRARGPATMEDWASDSSIPLPYKPDDSAIATGTSAYPAKGVQFSFYGTQVFDFVYSTDGTTKYYGKVVIRDITYAGAISSVATVSVSVILQPTAGEVSYFQ